MRYSIVGEPHAFQAACRQQGGYLEIPEIHICVDYSLLPWMSTLCNRS